MGSLLIFELRLPLYPLCVCVQVCACMCAIILQITLLLHHMFRIRQCWSLVSFLSTWLPLSPQGLLLHRSSCGTLLIPWEGDKLKCLVFFSGLEGKEMGKRNRGSLPAWEEEMGVLTFQSLCYSDEKFISLAFIFPRTGECTKFWHGTKVFWICLNLKLGPSLSWLQDKAKIWW